MRSTSRNSLSFGTGSRTFANRGTEAPEFGHQVHTDLTDTSNQEIIDLDEDEQDSDSNASSKNALETHMDDLKNDFSSDDEKDEELKLLQRTIDEEEETLHVLYKSEK